MQANLTPTSPIYHHPGQGQKSGLCRRRCQCRRTVVPMHMWMSGHVDVCSCRHLVLPPSRRSTLLRTYCHIADLATVDSFVLCTAGTHIIDHDLHLSEPNSAHFVADNPNLPVHLCEAAMASYNNGVVLSGVVGCLSIQQLGRDWTDAMDSKILSDHHTSCGLCSC